MKNIYNVSPIDLFLISSPSLGLTEKGLRDVCMSVPKYSVVFDLVMTHPMLYAYPNTSKVQQRREAENNGERRVGSPCLMPVRTFMLSGTRQSKARLTTAARYSKLSISGKWCWINTVDFTSEPLGHKTTDLTTPAQISLSARSADPHSVKITIYLKSYPVKSVQYGETILMQLWLKTFAYASQWCRFVFISFHGNTRRWTIRCLLRKLFWNVSLLFLISNLRNSTTSSGSFHIKAEDGLCVRQAVVTIPQLTGGMWNVIISPANPEAAKEKSPRVWKSSHKHTHILIYCFNFYTCNLL